MIHIVSTLADIGVNVVPGKNWQTYARPERFAPVGIMVHHTAGPRTGDAPSLRTCVVGRPGLLGPLCHMLIGRSGAVHVISAGHCNHAGSGLGVVLDLVINDKPVTLDARERPENFEGAPGNMNFYGIEAENAGDGKDPYPPAQLEALALTCAALCYVNDWSANRVIHHRQWTRRKIDMSYRGDLVGAVAERMRALSVRDCPYGDA